MTRTSTVVSERRSALLAHLAGAIAAALPAGRPLRVAVDGVDGAGKTMFADELAAALESRARAVVRASVDGFHHPRAVRYQRGRDSPEGFYRDSYDYAALRERLLDPFGPGGSRRYTREVFDHATDTVVDAPAHTAADDTVLVLDGIFLHRRELRGLWDFSVFLDVGFDVSIARCAARDGGSPDPAAAPNRRYVDGQRLYLAEARPRDRADVVVDNTDLAHPRIVAAT